MKTKALFVAIMLCLPLLMSAQETCTKIYDEGNDGSWTDKVLSYTQGQDLFLNKSKFSSAAPGNRLKIYGFLTGEGDHKLYLGEYDPSKHLPGSDYRDIGVLSGENPVYFYLTQDMIDAIVTSNKDCRIFGEGITVNRVDLCTGKAGALHDPFRTIWTGYFWAEDWSTLKLFKEALSVVTLSDYKAIRFYHEAGRTNFTMNLFGDNFDSGSKIATSESDGAIHLTPTCADLELTDAVITALTGVTRELYVQIHKGTGAAFNLTDIVLIPKAIDGCDNCFFVTY